MDLLVRRIEGTLGRGSPEGEPITADEIRGARFRTKLGGYHEIAVDFALEAFIVAIETRQVVSPSGPPEPRPAVPERTERREREPVFWDPGSEGRDPGATGQGPDSAGREAEAAGRDPGVGEREVRAAGWEPEAGEAPGLLDPAEVEEHAARVERAAFRPGRLGMGYDEEEVDAFLDRVVATLRGTTDLPLTSGDVRGARFATVMFRPGYAVGQVDEFLADLADVLEAHLGR